MTTVAEVEVDLGIPSLDSLVAKLTNHLEVRGYEQKEIDDRVNELERYYNAYVECRTTRRGIGRPLTEIARTSGIPRYLVKAYRRRNIPRLIRELINHAEDNSIVPKREKNVDFAYLLGIIISQRQKKEVHKRKKYAFGIGEKDPEIRTEIGRICDKFNIPYHTNRLEDTPRIMLHHCRATYFFSSVISDEGLPWEYLVSTEEREAFLSGYLDRKGSIRNKTKTKYCSLMLRKLPEKLLLDMVLLFGECDIYTGYNTKFGNIEVASREDMEKLGRILRSRKRKGKIREVIQNSPEPSIRLSTDKCVEFYDEREKEPDQKTVEIFQRLGIDIIPTERITKRIIKRAERFYQVEKIKREQRPDYDVIGYCYREVGVSSEAARALARVYRLDEIQEYEPKSIKRQAKLYDKSNDVNVLLELRKQKNYRRICAYIPRQIVAGAITPEKGLERLNAIAKESEIEFLELDNVYWASYLQALREQRIARQAFKHEGSRDLSLALLHNAISETPYNNGVINEASK